MCSPLDKLCQRSACPNQISTYPGQSDRGFFFNPVRGKCMTLCNLDCLGESPHEEKISWLQVTVWCLWLRNFKWNTHEDMTAEAIALRQTGTWYKLCQIKEVKQKRLQGNDTVFIC